MSAAALVERGEALMELEGEDVELRVAQAVEATGLSAAHLGRIGRAGTVVSRVPGDADRLGRRFSAKSLYSYLREMPRDEGVKAARLLAYVEDLRERNEAPPYPPHAG